jgi:hypothetical protein
MKTGGLRRAHVRGHENVLKRLLVHAGAFNLGLWMRTLFGVGTPRGLQGRLAARRGAQRVVEPHLRCDRADRESDSSFSTIGMLGERIDGV